MPRLNSEMDNLLSKGKIIKVKSADFDKLNKKLSKKPIRWFWKRWWWIDYWYDQTHNGIWGPGGRTYYKFRTGKLALLVSILALILVVIMFIKIVL